MRRENEKLKSDHLVLSRARVLLAVIYVRSLIRIPLVFERPVLKIVPLAGVIHPGGSSIFVSYFLFWDLVIDMVIRVRRLCVRFISIRCIVSFRVEE